MPLKKKNVLKEEKIDLKTSQKIARVITHKKVISSSIKTHKIYKSNIKRIVSPFNKLFIPKNKIKSKLCKMNNDAHNSIGGLSRNEKSYIICRCQNKLPRFLKLKMIAKSAIKENKIFSVYGSCNAVRNALLERGWVEKIPPNRMNLSKIRNGSLSDKKDVNMELERLLLSNLVEKYPPNFIWRTKEDRRDTGNDKTKDYNTLVNRLPDAMWTTKLGLCSTIKKNYWFTVEDIAEVHAPRAYISDSFGISDFEKDFKITACTSLLKWILSMAVHNRPIFTNTGIISINVIVFALNRCKEYILRQQNKDIDRTMKPINDRQWFSFLKKYYSIISSEAVFQADRNNRLHLYFSYAKFLLTEIHRYRPQLSCEGYHNMWIIKPAYCSRGRGIRMASKLGVMRNLLNKADSKYVIQKYIEEPLLIYETKFDIRQYYLITSTYPLIIWMYTDCYLKFSSQKYNLNNYHESIHLTNNAVQKKYANCKGRHAELPSSNMWCLEEYKIYLNKIGKDYAWENIIYPGMKKSVIGIMLSCQETMSISKNRFELYGCDFILDSDYKPWLIEINASPDLNHTTPVTAKICPAVVLDTIKVVIDYPRDTKKNTGNFECIYRQLMTMPKYVNGTELSVRGYSLPNEYFYRGNVKIRETYENPNISKQCDIQLSLKQLKTLHYADTAMTQSESDSNFSITRDEDINPLNNNLSQFEQSVKTNVINVEINEVINIISSECLSVSDTSTKNIISAPSKDKMNSESLVKNEWGGLTTAKKVEKLMFLSSKSSPHSDYSPESLVKTRGIKVSSDVFEATKQIITFINCKEQEYMNDVRKKSKIK